MYRLLNLAFENGANMTRIFIELHVHLIWNLLGQVVDIFVVSSTSWRGTREVRKSDPFSRLCWLCCGRRNEHSKRDSATL